MGHPDDADAKLVDEHERAAEERVLVRKIDVLLMPLLTISYGLQFYDKFVFSSAAVFGMLADLHLSTPVPGTNLVSTRRYSTATAAFYWGYLIGVLPIALLLRRLPVAKTLSCFIFIWGILAMATAGLSSYSGAVTLRFFLGLVESSVSPGFVLITASWYRPAELPVRLGIWYSATGLFTIFSGLVNYAIGHNVRGGLAPWKYMYIVAGSVTIFWSAVLFLLLPDTPASRSPAGLERLLFTPRERELLAERGRREDSSGTNGASKAGIEWNQVHEAALDVKIWIMAAMGAAIYVCNGGVTAFGSLIIKSFGYSSLRSIILQAPGGATTCVAIYISTWLLTPSSSSAGTRSCNRIGLNPSKLHHGILALSCIPVLIGSLLLWKGPPYTHAHGRATALAGYYLLPTFGAPYVVLLSLVAANVRGRTKRAVGAGAVFVGYCVGNVIGPYLVNTTEAPLKYRTTWISLIVCMVLTIVAAVGLRILLSRENARRDGLHHSQDGSATRTETANGLGKDEKGNNEVDHVMSTGHLDSRGMVEERTDKRDMSFRYLL